MVVYADVADTLPADIRTTIENTLPCVATFNGEHPWYDELTKVTDHRDVVVETLNRPRCAYCQIYWRAP